eukprot:CAMPEP_0202923986 /NCGR_PEP_ID=MMETSP1392-20130828/78736_1 /ASSEMBLY_ACC=CAM_ASM_000868 /TAXON_ID=225041 /ORGANISM="Chlamydomonas chlamydogama, Strain SAG 11-48b" /LENGTH=78 /DNA_ID=CAMNT_0049617689 /DNA_START=86 /DNA_END=319 /DNA_ORIENTATION=+
MKRGWSETGTSGCMARICSGFRALLKKEKAERGSLTGSSGGPARGRFMGLPSSPAALPGSAALVYSRWAGSSGAKGEW